MASDLDIDWAATRLVVFDVDGTLYSQHLIRRRMLGMVLLHCLLHPGDLALVRVIQRFRRMREELAEEEATDARRLQYERPAARLGVPPERVRDAVEEWMQRRPLPYLRRCRLPGVGELFDALRARGTTIGVFSDYPVDAKLAALGLAADLTISSTDPEVDRFKPHPAGLLRLLERAGAAPGESLMIGDRDERDGECARRAGVPFLLRAPEAQPGPGRFSDYHQLLASLRTGRP